MTRLEAETLILQRMKEIKDIYREYNPEGQFLNLTVFKEGLFTNNKYWGEDRALPIDACLLEDDRIMRVDGKAEAF